MSQRKALQHMIAWGIQRAFDTNKEALEILNNKDLSDEEKTLRVKGPNGTDWRLLNLLVLLKPAIDQAQKEYPEQTDFFNWFNSIYTKAVENKMLNGDCGCKGCNKGKPAVKEEPTKSEA